MRLTLNSHACVHAGRYVVAAILATVLSACGGGGGSPGTVVGGGGSGSDGSTTGVDSISLLFSSPELQSGGTSASDVTVTALVKNASNAALSGAPVTITADSGILTNLGTASDQTGRVTATLGTSGDRTNRVITVTAKSGSKSATGTVSVVGTSLSVVGPSSISAGGTGDFTFTIKDSAKAAVAGVPVTITSARGNPVAVKTSGGGTSTLPLTNTQGQVIVTLTASQAQADVLKATAQGTEVSAAIDVKAAKVTVSVLDGAGGAITTATTTSCGKVMATYDLNNVPQSGTVNITTSRGRIYSDSACSTVLPSSTVTLTSGVSQPVYLRSDTVGVATIGAAVTNGPSASTNVEFTSALTSLATIHVQAEPAIIGSNIGTSQSQRTTVTAVVRDGTADNNFVKNAPVEFTIIKDASGGTISSPNVVSTESNGTATVSFIAGTGTTPQDGVVIEAKIQGTSKTAQTFLTVSQRSLFVSAGTGNQLKSLNDTTYQKDYVVFVTDASGNPVSGVAVTATLVPTRYKKGDYQYVTVNKKWEQQYDPALQVCMNEDSILPGAVGYNGVLDEDEDYNHNDRLDPGIPANVSPGAVTDTNGTATISITYPKDRAQWVEVRLNVRASVAGTEAIYPIAAHWLPILAADISSADVSPPGAISPYGVNNCNIKD